MANVDKLISAVEDMCKLYVGKNAEGETWAQTLARIEQLKKLAKAARKEVDRGRSSQSKG